MSVCLPVCFICLLSKTLTWLYYIWSVGYPQPALPNWGVNTTGDHLEIIFFLAKPNVTVQQAE